MLAVVADDITGAAEIAGIAHEMGLRVRMVLALKSIPSCDVLVVATDTRSLSATEAARISHDVMQQLAGRCDVFKKTDSALRGNVVAELEALLAANPRYKRALYVPANPSKGRIIVQNEYLICGVPINETAFSYDPEYPALTANLMERFPEMRQWTGSSDAGLYFANAESEEDLQQIAATIDQTTLPSGAADFFKAYISQYYVERINNQCVNNSTSVTPNSTFNLPALVLCGSTQSNAESVGFPICYMPTDAFCRAEGGAEWGKSAADMYDSAQGLVLSFGKEKILCGKEVAIRLRQTMVQAAQYVINQHHPSRIIIEGGATAYALLVQLHWQDYRILGNLAPGVVSLLADNDTEIIMKPGSYPWQKNG